MPSERRFDGKRGFTLSEALAELHRARAEDPRDHGGSLRGQAGVATLAEDRHRALAALARAPGEAFR